MEFTGTNTLAHQCYETLLTDIINGTLKPGQKLKIEPLKSRFGVGQSPLREALSRLVASGLVQTEDNKGFRVTQLSVEDIQDTYATFTAIELLALKLSIERGDAEWKAGVVSELYKLSLIEHSSEPVEYAVWAEQNYRFHVALISGCQSPLLLEIRKNLYGKFDRYCRLAYQTTRERLAVNHTQHDALAQAALKGDYPTAAELMDYHINGALDDVIARLAKNKLM